MDALLARGLRCITVLDISGAALARARSRVGSAGAAVRWLEADVADGGWTAEQMDVWHDRAAFHFLVDEQARRRYVRRMLDTVKPAGTIVMATFAADGPERCSGLPVRRYSPEALAAELGPEVEPVETRREEHRTPAGAVQAFQWTRFRRR